MQLTLSISIVLIGFLFAVGDSSSIPEAYLSIPSVEKCLGTVVEDSGVTERCVPGRRPCGCPYDSWSEVQTTARNAYGQLEYCTTTLSNVPVGVPVGAQPVPALPQSASDYFGRRRRQVEAEAALPPKHLQGPFIDCFDCRTTRRDDGSGVVRADAKFEEENCLPSNRPLSCDQSAWFQLTSSNLVPNLPSNCDAGQPQFNNGVLVFTGTG